MRAIPGTTVMVVLVLTLSATAEQRSPLARRLEQVRALVSDRPGGYDRIFAPSFLKAVPPAKLAPVLRDYHKKGGPVVSVLQLASTGEHAAEYRFFTRSTVFPVKLAVSAKPPHQVTALWFGLQAPRYRSLDQVVTALKALPGQVSFAVCQLGGKTPRLVQGLNPKRPLALGSTFKLYVLGALVQAVDHGGRRWGEVVPLRQEWRSWPSGILQEWPAGTPVTLATLAHLMISISDNTATDHLLYTLGRKAVEGMLKPMGQAQPARNVPFLGTRELFLLKEAGKGAGRLQQYLARKVEGRRAYLERVLAKDRRKTFGGLDRATPTAIDRAEWFASAADLCRAMDWLRTRTASSGAAPIRGSLSINRGGLVFREAKWRYVGYKGGSEPGVLNLTYLLERADGRWFVLSAGWNNPLAVLDDEKLLEIAQGAVLILEHRR